MRAIVTLGIDVSKDKLDAALWLAASRKWFAVKVRNDAVGIAKLLQWVATKSKVAIGDCRVALEPTGVYHDNVAQAFHEAGYPVVMANPKRVRDFASGIGQLAKTDKLDARVLAQYGQVVEEAMIWQPPAPEIIVLRALLARLEAIEKDEQREANRLEAARATDNTPQAVFDSLQRSLASLAAERQRLEQAIRDHDNNHPGLKQELNRLKSVPGIGDKTANVLLSLLRRRTFESARQAAAYVGLNVLPYESGSSVRKATHLSKRGDAYVRAKLYMPAIVAARHNPPLRQIYQDLIARGKSKKAALAAVMRRLIHIAFGILKHQTVFNPALVSSKFA